MTDVTTSGANDDPRPLPESLADGLDVFVTTWLEKWTDAGGSVILHDERLQIGYRPYNDSPDYQEPAEDLPHWVKENSRNFSDGIFTGKMRTLCDLICTVPHARDALKAHMRSHGLAHYYGQPGTVS